MLELFLDNKLRLLGELKKMRKFSVYEILYLNVTADGTWNDH
jgi:hypothetical protein